MFLSFSLHENLSSFAVFDLFVPWTEYRAAVCSRAPSSRLLLLAAANRGSLILLREFDAALF